MNTRELDQSLRNLLGDTIAEQLLPAIDMVAQVWSDVALDVNAITAVAFLAGALAIASGARMALLGALFLVGAQILVLLGMLPEAPIWLEPLAFALVIAGLVQGVLTLVLGEQTAGTLLTALLVGSVLMVIWHGPARLLRLVGALAMWSRGR